MHARRAIISGSAGPAGSFAEEAGPWKTRVRDGYVMRRITQADGTRRLIMQHREVMEEMLGRPLRDDETVHHKNGVRSDNRPGNLELWASPQPYGQRVTDLVAFAQMILERYEGEVAA